ncbi:MAG: hypothetical protein RL318_960 [Fibrobacterota bacterium]|jgi:hypothetical protein
MARAEFILPVAGEQVSPEGTGIVYSSPVKAWRVDFYWNGAVKGDVKAKDLGDGLWQARLGAMVRGPVSLRAISRDSSGNVLADESIAFRSGEAPSSNDKGSRWIQSLSLSGGGGVRGGLSEGTIEKRSALTYADGKLVQGESSSPLDNQVGAWGNSLWQVENGLFQARLRLAGDLRENQFEQSANQYGADLSWGPWLALRVGDQFPVWDPLLMDGVRVRGASVEMAATSEGVSWLRGKLLAGQLRRQTSAWIGWTASNDSMVTPGTWERQMVAAQLSVGKGENFLGSLTFERAWDVSDAGNEALRPALQGPAPAENVGAAMDLHLWWLRHKLEWYGNAAISAVTENRYTNTFADSTMDSLDLEIPSALSSLIPVNSTTRGTQRLLGGDVGEWFNANTSWRTGLRFRESWGRAFTLREEIKVLHRGMDFESFARSVRESGRDGLEWSQGLGFLSNQLDLSSTVGIFTIPDGYGGEREETSYQVTSSFATGRGTSLYLTGSQRTQESDSSGGYTSRGANMGASQPIPSSAGTVSLRLGYGIQQDRSSLVATSITVVQNSVNGQVRFRPRDGAWEPRVSWQLNHQDLSHVTEQRVLAGVGARLLDRRLDLQLDAGGSMQAFDDHSRWSRLEQMASASLSVGDASSVRLSQQVAWLNPRMDVRADLSWETFF